MTAVAAFLGAIALVAIIQWISPSVFPGLFMSVARPFWQTEFSIQSGALRSPAQLLSENEALKRRLSEIETSISSSSVETLILENAELKAQLGRATSTPRVLAAVLSRPPLSPYDELIIDVGKDKGASSTTLVYAPNNVLIGRVREAYSHTSKVMLFTSPGQTYSVSIGSAHAPITAIGEGGGQYRAEVPRGSSVQVGDVVLDPFMNDSAFGTVVSVKSDPANPFDSVFIAPSVSLYQIRWVYLDLRI